MKKPDLFFGRPKEPRPIMAPSNIGSMFGLSLITATVLIGMLVVITTVLM